MFRKSVGVPLHVRLYDAIEKGIEYVRYSSSCDSPLEAEMKRLLSITRIWMACVMIVASKLDSKTLSADLLCCVGRLRRAPPCVAETRRHEFVIARRHTPAAAFCSRQSSPTHTGSRGVKATKG